jgi:hypothetical protein
MDHDPAAIKRESQQTINGIKDHLSWLQEAVAPYNRQLEELVRSDVRQRKDRLLKDANMAEAIGLPMKKREGAPVTYAVPVKRRVPRFEEIKVKGTFKPEPALAITEYEEILRIMKSMAQVMERSPHEFSDMGKETLRSHFPTAINGAPIPQTDKRVLKNCPLAFKVSIGSRSYRLGSCSASTGRGAARRNLSCPQAMLLGSRHG